MEAFWRGTHLDKEDRAVLSRTVTLGSFNATSPMSQMAPSMSSGSYFSNTDDVEYTEDPMTNYGDMATSPSSNQENDSSSLTKKFYFEDGDVDVEQIYVHQQQDADATSYRVTRQTHKKSTSLDSDPHGSNGDAGSSCAVSPTLDEDPDAD